MSGTHASAVAAALDVLRPESVLIFVCPNAGESVAWINHGGTTGKEVSVGRFCGKLGNFLFGKVVNKNSVDLDWNQKSIGISLGYLDLTKGPYLE